MEFVNDESGQETPNDESGQESKAGTEKLATCDGDIDGVSKKDDIPKKELSVAADRVCNFCRDKSIFLKICVVFFEPGTANLDEDWKGEIQI